MRRRGSEKIAALSHGQCLPRRSRFTFPWADPCNRVGYRGRERMRHRRWPSDRCDLLTVNKTYRYRSILRSGHRERRFWTKNTHSACYCNRYYLLPLWLLDRMTVDGKTSSTRCTSMTINRTTGSRAMSVLPHFALVIALRSPNRSCPISGRRSVQRVGGDDCFNITTESGPSLAVCKRIP